MIKLSVVMPARNEFPNNVHTLYSIIHAWEAEGKDPDELELIIVDNCSDDDVYPQRGTAGTTSYLEGRGIYHAAKLRILRDPVAGNHSARNKGAEIARGKYLFFTDGHMAYRPGFFTEMIRTIDESDGLFHGGIAWMGAYPPAVGGVGFSYTIKLGEEWKGCVDEETELLTKTGWKKWNEVDMNTEFATLNRKYNDIDFQKPEDLTITDYNGEMVRLKGRSVDVLLTPTHRTLYVEDNKTKVKPASEITPKDKIPIASDGYRGIYKEVISNDMVELIGWIVTEGSYGKRYVYDSFPSRKRKMVSNPTIVITQFIPEKRKKIKRLLDRMGLSYCIKGKKKDFKIHQRDSRRIMKILPKKELTFDFILHLTGVQQRLLYETLIEGDGHREKSKTKFYQVNKNTSDAFELLCLCIGKTTRTKIRKPHKDRYGKKLQQDITVKKRKSTSGYRVTREKYKGKVWCPTLDNGTIIIKRNGIVSYSAQTWNPYHLGVNDWWAIPSQGHCSVGVKRDQFFDFGGYPKVHRTYGGGEFYIDMKWWMLGSRVVVNPNCIGYHLSSSRGYAYHHDDYVENVLGCSYALGCDDWRERTYINGLRKGRKEVMDKIMQRNEKEYGDDREFVKSRKVKDFNDLLVERPWDKLNEQRYGKSNGAMTVFHYSWLNLLTESSQALDAYRKSKHQKKLEKFIEDNLNEFIYRGREYKDEEINKIKQKVWG